MRRWIGGLGAAGLVAFLTVGAQALNSYHIRGTLTGFDGVFATVDTGTEVVPVKLKHRARVYIVDAARIEDIAEGQFVGVTSIESGGKRVALELHIFEESLRGASEGHYPWRRVSQDAMMTTANIVRLVEAGPDRTLTLNYLQDPRDETSVASQTITVPAEIPVVRLSRAARDDLAAGGPVFLIAYDVENIGPVTTTIVVGRNGVAPPM